MATIEKEVSSPSYTWFYSPTATLSLCVHEQRQKIARLQQDINTIEESVDTLTLERTELITNLQPHKEYKAAFDATSATINQKIAIVRNGVEAEEVKSARIGRMKAQLQLCQEQINKAGTVNYIKQQEKQVKELDLQIEELEQDIEQKKVNLSSLQSALTKAEKELERKKPELMALSVKYLKNILTSLNEKSTTTLVR